MVTDTTDFWSHVDQSNEDGCWLWTGNVHTTGYGRYHGVYAHRVAYELGNGPIGHGKYVCHHCDALLCCRPSHLFSGSQADNIRDCIAKGRFRGGGGPKTHCPRGHEYTEANTYFNKKGCKVCRACAITRAASYYDMKRLNSYPAQSP